VFPLLESAWLALTRRPDAVHAGDVYPQAVVAWILKKLFRIPYLVYCHGEEITQLDRNRYLSRVRNVVYRQADAVVTNSDFSRTHLLRLGVSPSRICKISPGVDCERFSPGAVDPQLTRKYDLEGCFVLLTVARLVPRKGHRLVMEAIAKLNGDVANIRYVIVGTGPEKESLLLLAAALGIADRVHLAGHVPDEQLADYYKLADLLVMPNYQEARTGDVEGFGMVFLEANACGKPVIGGRSGGAAEAVVDGVTGFLVNPEDSTELAGRIGLLANNASLRHRLGMQGLERASNEFSWTTRAALLHAVHMDIVNSNGIPASAPTIPAVRIPE
jgi:phosphatidylinositol alpha-1,6-mannosyltransferase